MERGAFLGLAVHLCTLQVLIKDLQMDSCLFVGIISIYLRTGHGPARNSNANYLISWMRKELVNGRWNCMNNCSICLEKIWMQDTLFALASALQITPKLNLT